MDRYDLSEAAATALLVRLSRHHNVAIAVVAEAIIAAERARQRRVGG
jgi:hypothetical protein